jgi:hypothetical protein
VSPGFGGLSGCRQSRPPHGRPRCLAAVGSSRDDPTKPFSGADENRPETKMRSNRCDQTMESVVWDIIISLIYHQSCRNYLAATRKSLWA